MTSTIILIGVSGAGKSDIARAIAAKSGLVLHNFEESFESLMGEDDSQFLVRRGEAQYEEAALRVAMDLLDREGVITLAPGVVRTQKVAEKLRVLRAGGALVVEVFADISTLMRRTGLNAPRSVALGPTRKIFTEMVAAYRADFEGLADLVIDTSLSKPEHVAARVLAFDA
ncbi:shikimate kinase [Actinomyces urinae]|uniref:shikimate kinase n=1 Tax=Actinomyces urinae TaxID=1689268 RepID=UPI000930FA7B|nr:shikimate kinase [Actinomyces urinae]